jgi:DNA-binding LacI/PurR family transcriptional regulator
LSSSLESSFILDKARETFDHVVLYGIEKTGFNCVLPDRKAGAYQAVRYLAGLGHKKIAFMKSPGRIVNRLKTWHTGYLKAIREFDLMESESLIWEYEEIDSCIAKLKRAISKKDSARPTGIFIPWAGTAQDIEIKMIEAGIKIPDDISIVTFNDRFLQKPGYPGVTTVSASNESLGEETAEMLLSLINFPGAQTSTTVKILPVSLIERESCGRTKE